MRTTFKIDRPDDIEVTLTTTMKLSEWKLIARDLSGNSYASIRLTNSIREVVNKAEQTFVSIQPEVAPE
jgi:hypothetical protein